MTCGIRNNITRHGQGSPCYVFAHGFGCDQNIWRYVAPAFAESAQVVLYDQVGAGRSDPTAYEPMKYATLQGYADDLIEICETLARPDLIFVGHSVSCTVGVLAARRRPDLFERLVLICPSPCYIDIGEYRGGFSEADIDELLDLLDKNHLEWASVMAPVVMGAASDPGHQAEWRDSVCRVDPQIAKDFAQVTFKSDHRADYHAVGQPTLLIECRYDALASEVVGAYVHGAIPGSRREILDATGHCPHVTAASQVIASIAEFVSERRPVKAA